MDMEQLMTKDGMRAFTNEQRQTFTNDAVEVRQLAQIIQARLAHTEIDGDRTGSATRRARKVTRKMHKVARLLERAAAETEALNAVYLREVEELPARRARQLEQKDQRRQQFGITAASVQGVAAKSLAKSTNTLAGIRPPTAVPGAAVPPPVQYVSPQPWGLPGQNAAAQPLPSIADVFDQEAM